MVGKSLLVVTLVLLAVCPVMASTTELKPRVLALGFGQVSSLAFSRDGHFLAVGGEGGQVRVLETSGWTTIGSCAHGGWINCIAFSPDGETIATGTQGNDVVLWAAATGEWLRSLLDDRPSAFYVLSVAFSPDGKVLASGEAAAGSISLWDVANGLRLCRTGYGDFITFSVAFSPDGRTLASGSGNLSAGLGVVDLWDATTGGPMWTLAERAAVLSVAFSPDGKLLAVGLLDGTVALWDVQTGVLIRTLTGHAGAVWSVAFSPDGRLLASGSEDASVKVWSFAQGMELRTLSGHTAPVLSVAFSPVSQALASGSADGSVRIWEIGTGR